MEKFGDRPALAYESNDAFKNRREGLKPGVEPAAPDYKIWSWKEYYADCVRFSKSLTAIGAEAADIVNILGFNSPEWLIANNGAQLNGGIAAGIYATNTADACQWLQSLDKDYT